MSDHGNPPGRRAGQFNQVAYELRFVLSVNTKYRNVSGLLKRLEPLERLELS